MPRNDIEQQMTVQLQKPMGKGRGIKGLKENKEYVVDSFIFIIKFVIIVDNMLLDEGSKNRTKQSSCSYFN